MRWPRRCGLRGGHQRRRWRCVALQPQNSHGRGSLPLFFFTAHCVAQPLAPAIRVVHPASQMCLPARRRLQAAASLATSLAAASPACAAALAASALVGSLVALLEAASTQVSPDAKLDVLSFFRQAAARAQIRDAVSGLPWGVDRPALD